MDHHCLLINNCVGARNYRHFLLAVFYLWLGCLLFLILGFCAEGPPRASERKDHDQRASVAIATRRFEPLGSAPKESVNAAADSKFLVELFSALWELSNLDFVPAGLHGLRFRAEMCWLNAFWCYVLTTYLLLTHAQLVLANETSIEAAANARLRSKNRERNLAFDLGWRRNFEEVFGPGNPWSLRWLLPPVVLPLPGDHCSTA